jgi:hypothetical protein
MAAVGWGAPYPWAQRDEQGEPPRRLENQCPGMLRVHTFGSRSGGGMGGRHFAFAQPMSEAHLVAFTPLSLLSNA